MSVLLLCRVSFKGGLGMRATFSLHRCPAACSVLSAVVVTMIVAELKIADHKH